MIATGAVIASGSGVLLVARILGNSGSPITQASLGALTWTLTDLSNALALGSGSFSIAGTVYDALQQSDPRWQLDSAAEPGPDGRWGYNFLAQLPASVLAASALSTSNVATGRRRVQCDVLFTPATGEPFRQIFVWTVANVYG